MTISGRISRIAVDSASSIEHVDEDRPRPGTLQKLGLGAASGHAEDVVSGIEEERQQPPADHARGACQKYLHDHTHTPEGPFRPLE